MDTWGIAEEFLTAKRTNWKEATYTNKRYHLLHFAAACPTLPETPTPIEAFLGSIPGELYRYNHWCTVRQLYAWAKRRRRGVKDPCATVEAPRKPVPVPYWLEEDELLRLLNHPDHPPRDRALLFLLADTGMRIGEAHSMTVENIKGDWLLVNGKTGWRWVPVHPKVMEMLQAIAPGYGPFWVGLRGPMTKNGLSMAVRVAFLRAGFRGEKMSPHRLRHTFATLYSGSDSDAMDVGGWKNWATYRIYRTTRPKKLAASHEEHSPVAQLVLV